MVYIGQESFRIYGDIRDKNIDEPVFECDELLAPAIQILNFLGYKTISCCSGHLVGVGSDCSNCYIQFQNSMSELREMGFVPINEAVPMSDSDKFVLKQFIFRARVDGTSELRRMLNSESGRLFEIMNSAAALTRWAARLHKSNALKDAIDMFTEKRSYESLFEKEVSSNE